MMPARKWIPVMAVTFGVTLLAACIPPPRGSVTSLDQVDQGVETLLVGKVELVPPLQPEEYEFEAATIGAAENMAYVLTSEEQRRLRSQPTLSDYEGRIDAPLGEFFFVETPARPFYIVGAHVLVASGEARPDDVYLPGGLKVSVTPNDRAVYIGTLRYHRNEFFEITKVELIDEYDAARKALVGRFNDASGLTRRLVTVASD